LEYAWTKGTHPDLALNIPVGWERGWGQRSNKMIIVEDGYRRLLHNAFSSCICLKFSIINIFLKKVSFIQILSFSFMTTLWD
jgi:hypothetical protein